MEVRKGGKEYFNKSYIKHHPEYLFIFEDTLEDEEFEKYLPGKLSDEEKEMVYNIVSPSIKEIKLPNISDIKEKFKVFCKFSHFSVKALQKSMMSQ